MKTTLFILMLLLPGIQSKAQRLAMTETETHRDLPVENKAATDKVPQFTFQNYGIDLNHSNLKEYPSHILGEQVARKMFAVQKAYVRHHPASVGFTDNTIEIYKPAIYNALVKLDSYFKKAVRRNEMNPGQASEQFSKCLDIVYVVYYEEETEDLELAVKKAKSPQQLLALFNSISIKE